MQLQQPSSCFPISVTSRPGTIAPERLGEGQGTRFARHAELASLACTLRAVVGFIKATTTLVGGAFIFYL